MNADREMLELAAKAAGIAVIRSRLNDPIHHGLLINNSERNPHQAAGPWNPFENDGDALRLAVRLRINLEFGASHVYAVNTKIQAFYADEESEGLLENATRNVIVRAAAAIGKAMP